MMVDTVSNGEERKKKKNCTMKVGFFLALTH